MEDVIETSASTETPERRPAPRAGLPGHRRERRHSARARQRREASSTPDLTRREAPSASESDAPMPVLDAPATTALAGSRRARRARPADTSAGSSAPLVSDSVADSGGARSNTRPQRSDPRPVETPPSGRPTRLPFAPADAERDARFSSGQDLWSRLVLVASLGGAGAIGWLVASGHGPRSLDVAGVLLALAAIACAVMARRPAVSLEQHRELVRSWRPQHVPSVDVLLPSTDEDLAVLANTFAHVRLLEWTGELNVYVLDDAGRDEVGGLARQAGFSYLSSGPDGRLGRAEIVRSAFANASGELVTVLDAGFVPRADLLVELAPYFEAAQTGAVTSIVSFDVNENLSWPARRAARVGLAVARLLRPEGATRSIVTTMSTGSLYRRAALERAGLAVAASPSGRVEAAVDLDAAGYRVREVPSVLTRGMCPTSRTLLDEERRRLRPAPVAARR